MSKPHHQTVISYLPYNSNMFYLEHFQKLSKGSFEVIDKKKTSMLQNMARVSKNKNKDKNNQVYKFYKNQEHSDKFMKFHSQRDSSEIIDRILMKGALSNLKISHPYPSNNTSIQTDDISSTKLKSGYVPLGKINENEQQNKSKYIKSQRSTKKIDLGKLHSINENNLLRERQERKGTLVQNQWQNSMNIVRLEKKENQKAKKYCRIMIRRINTDLLLTKSHESHPKREKHQKRLFNSSLKTIKPIINKSSETSFMKIPDTSQRMNAPLFGQVQALEVNPWSTTELRPQL